MDQNAQAQPLDEGASTRETAGRIYLPDYQDQLATYHRAYAAELCGIIASLPLRPGDRVLDMACGDGTYSLWLAEHVGAAGRIVGVDCSRDYLRLAHQRAQAGTLGSRIRFVSGGIDDLPFDNDQFDLTWCAQSFYSLPEPVGALRELGRVTRPGGVVAVLENDTLHQLLLPWPTGLELLVRWAEFQALARESGNEEKFYIGRRLRAIFGAAGLMPCRTQTHVFDRHAPLGEDEAKFLESYLETLGKRVRPWLEPRALAELDALLRPDSERYLLSDPHFTMTCLNVVVWGLKAG